MKRFSRLGLFLLGFAGLTSVAHADTANFQARCNWNATNTAFTCTFDAERPTSSPSACSSGLAPDYKWTFGDNSSPTSFSPYTSSISHTYNSPIANGYHVTLEIRCYPSNLTTADLTRYMCVFGIGGAGCIRVDGTWN